jgi:hypothetical protein
MSARWSTTDLAAGDRSSQAGHGRYLDEWVRFEERWVIKRRRYVHEFQEIRRVERDMAPATKVPSRRDQSDVSYSLTPKLTFD